MVYACRFLPRGHFILRIAYRIPAALVTGCSSGYSGPNSTPPTPTCSSWIFEGPALTLALMQRSAWQTCSLCVQPMGGVTMTQKRGRDVPPRKHEPHRHGPESITYPPPGPSSHRQPYVAGLGSVAFLVKARRGEPQLSPPLTRRFARCSSRVRRTSMRVMPRRWRR